MYFSPHILQVLAEEKPKYDSNGQVIVKPENNTWETIGVCRCDDDNTQELKVRQWRYVYVALSYSL